MALPNLLGLYSLTASGINAAVKSTSPGVYALGKTDGNTFYVGYVGRSDDDVNDRLHDHETLSDPQFKFAYCSSAQAAFYAECELYHTYGGRRNPNHPARPAGTSYKCPRCSLFG